MTKLHNLGFQHQEPAKEELKYIGRNGALPWASHFFLRTLPYIMLTSFNLLPVAHLFLMGLIKTLLVYSLLSKSVKGGHYVIFSLEQREAVRVCCCTCTAVNGPSCIIPSLHLLWTETSTQLFAGGLEESCFPTCICICASRPVTVPQEVQNGGGGKPSLGGVHSS
jgi:hypothetical protein